MLFHNAPAPYRVSVPFVFALTAVIGGTLGIRDRQGARAPPPAGDRRPERDRRRARRRPRRRHRLRPRRALARPDAGRRAPARRATRSRSPRSTTTGSCSPCGRSTQRPRTRLTVPLRKDPHGCRTHRTRDRRLPADPAAVLGAEGRARVRAGDRVPARAPVPAAEGAGPVLPDPGDRPDGQGRPADDHAQHPAAGRDHEGQRARCASTRSRTSGSSSRRTRSSRSRTTWSRRRRSPRRRCGRCSASTSSTSCSPSATRSTRSSRRSSTRRRARGGSRSRSSRSRTSRSRAGCSARWPGRPRPSASGARR